MPHKTIIRLSGVARNPANGFPARPLEVSTETILVAGGTRPDAIVGVNGDPVEINALGIFSTTVTLEEGPNFIEVVATDIQGNVRFQTVAAFYLP